MQIMFSFRMILVNQPRTEIELILIFVKKNYKKLSKNK